MFVGFREWGLFYIDDNCADTERMFVICKGILHSALHNEYWRLIDPQGKPPGVMGWWPSRAVTFLENHDTGSTQVCFPDFVFGLSAFTSSKEREGCVCNCPDRIMGIGIKTRARCC